MLPVVPSFGEGCGEGPGWGLPVLLGVPREPPRLAAPTAKQALDANHRMVPMGRQAVTGGEKPVQTPYRLVPTVLASRIEGEAISTGGPRSVG